MASLYSKADSIRFTTEGLSLRPTSWRAISQVLAGFRSVYMNVKLGAKRPKILEALHGSGAGLSSRSAGFAWKDRSSWSLGVFVM